MDRDTLELTMTLTDPKMYTAPWVSEKKVMRLVPSRELPENFFASLRRSRLLTVESGILREELSRR